jgi:hypothetical protein
MACERLMFILLTKDTFLSVTQCKQKSPYLFVFVGHQNVMFVSTPVNTLFLRELTQFGGNWWWCVLKRSINLVAVLCGIPSIRLAIGIYAHRHMYIDGSHCILFSANDCLVVRYFPNVLCYPHHHLRFSASLFAVYVHCIYILGQYWSVQVYRCYCLPIA